MNGDVLSQNEAAGAVFPQKIPGLKVFGQDLHQLAVDLRRQLSAGKAVLCPGEAAGDVVQLPAGSCPESS